jgi:hypothetical protein
MFDVKVSKKQWLKMAKGLRQLAELIEMREKYRKGSLAWEAVNERVLSSIEQQAKFYFSFFKKAL